MNSYDSLLSLIAKPGRYSGNEFNVIKKDWQTTDVRIALAFPDLYEIGMSHQGLQILYRLINSRKTFLAERVYTPDHDLEKLLRQQKMPLFSLESRRSLADFDMLGITLPYELCYTNILTVLDLSSIPFYAVDRNQSHPLVVGGGSAAFHSEPVAEYFDIILLGDGEEAILEIAETIQTAKCTKVSRSQLLAQLSTLTGIYVPRFFTPHYNNGRFQRIHANQNGANQVRRRILPDLNTIDDSSPRLVPLVRIIHDRLAIEIARGCTRGCRFCQAGIIYRPARERSLEHILTLATQGIEQTGFEELALLSLSTGDYSCLNDLLLRLMNVFARQRVSISMPSMRVGTLNKEVMEQIRRVRKTGFTLAPEAGTDRLRRVINKGITEADLLATCRSAFGLGWNLIKLYFMFGLPTETKDDLAAIPELARKALAVGMGGRHRINVSAATFVPKPHTPFELEPQLSVTEGFSRIDFLKNKLRGRGLNLKWNDPRQSFLEGVFSRGDRRLSKVIEEAWRRGARLDGWSEHFNLDLWHTAAKTCNIDLADYLRRRTPQEPLPWQHLSTGVDQTFLRDELDKADREIYTPDCRLHGCQGCATEARRERREERGQKSETRESGNGKRRAASGGVTAQQEGKTRCALLLEGRRERAEERGKKPEIRKAQRRDNSVCRGGAAEPSPAARFVYRCSYTKTGQARFLGHLDLMQVFFRSFRRAKLPLNFSQGFNPAPQVSFAPALPLGTESLAEYLFIDLYKPLSDMRQITTELNRQLPDGLMISTIVLSSKAQHGKLLSSYQITLNNKVKASDLDKFKQAEEYFVEVVRKKKKRQISVKPLIHKLSVTTDGKVQLALISETGKTGIKPMEFLSKIFYLSQQATQIAKVLKTKVEEYNCAINRTVN